MAIAVLFAPVLGGVQGALVRPVLDTDVVAGLDGRGGIAPALGEGGRRA